eukprot:TRINITY_DN32980_c0_g1_i1.p3 TRINITY_DN32980_c0_g1~~TRINITY_DN32980_c0_g1_i1.p3  ORF type:complete len:105 (-),score=18.44 TRINITY_DN32980_c0_g1_i1:118-432(-)
MNDYQILHILEYITLNYIHCKISELTITKKQFEQIYQKFISITNQIGNKSQHLRKLYVEISVNYYNKQYFASEQIYANFLTKWEKNEDKNEFILYLQMQIIASK